MSIQLKLEDLERHHALVRRETEIRETSLAAYQQVAREASQLVDDISEREGVDMRRYDINWETGYAKPKTVN